MMAYVSAGSNPPLTSTSNGNTDEAKNGNYVLDITEEHLDKYLDQGLCCFFEAKAGLIGGLLHKTWDEVYQVRDPLLITTYGQIYDLYHDSLEDDAFEIPDETIIGIFKGYDIKNDEMIIWGITAFDSEDSVELIEPYDMAY